MSSSDEQRISQFDLEAATAPQTGTLGYYFPWNDHMETFDTTSFNTQYSYGRISINDIDVLMRDINLIEDIKIQCCDSVGLLLCSIPLIIILVSIVQLLQNSRNKNIFLIFGGLIAAYILMMIIGTIMNKRQKDKQHKRKMNIVAVLAKHQSTTFEGKECILKVSTHGAYIAIEFSFMFNGQQGGFPAQPQFTNYNQPSYGAPQNNPFASPSDYRPTPGF